MIAEEPDEFAMWTIALLQNPEYCKKLGWNGRKLVEEKYEWNILGRHMIRLYEQETGFNRRKNETEPGRQII
jgi:glycosyltransferase involved in cell wall biosynthesis